MGKTTTRKATSEELAKIQKWEGEGKLKPNGKKVNPVLAPEISEPEKRILEIAENSKISKIGEESVSGKQNATQPTKTQTQPTKTQDKPKKAKTQTPEEGKSLFTQSQPNVVTMEGNLTTKEVAAMVNTTPKALRRVLRAKWYGDGKHTNYRWTPDSPELKLILQHYNVAPPEPQKQEKKAGKKK